MSWPQRVSHIRTSLRLGQLAKVEDHTLSLCEEIEVPGEDLGRVEVPPSNMASLT